MSASDSSRVGFWRRVVAIVFDFMLVSLLVTVMGVWLFGVTGGKVRVSNTLVNNANCTGGEGAPAKLKLPENFKVTNVARCTHSVFGIPYDWTLTVIEEKTKTGPNTTTTRAGTSIAFGSTIVATSTTNMRSFTLPLDVEGRVADPFYLDNLSIYVFAAYLFLFEWRFGATMGQRILGIRVRALDGTPMDFSQASKRILMRMVPLLPSMAGSIYFMVVGPMQFVNSVFEWPIINYVIAAAVALLMIAFLVNFIVTTSRRTLPWHDRWAGTEALATIG